MHQISLRLVNNKRKEGSDSRDTPFKKPKKVKLSSDELARARRDNLCFLCLGNHERKHCPQKKGYEPEEGGKGTDKVCTACKFYP